MGQIILSGWVLEAVVLLPRIFCPIVCAFFVFGVLVTLVIPKYSRSLRSLGKFLGTAHMLLGPGARAHTADLRLWAA